MKAFILREMLLVSFIQRKAKRVRFHPSLTVIRGNNETGKSSLIKSIPRTFGAEPAKSSTKWTQADVKSVVYFSLDGRDLCLLRHGRIFAVFESGRLLGRFQGVTQGLAPFLAELFSFGLRLPSRGHELLALPPAYYLLPFYMDQDSSWQRPWSGFTKLEQIPNWKKSLAEYHAGIRGNEYYEAQGRVFESEAELNRLTRKREGLQEVFRDLETKYQAAEFNVDFSAYRAEVEELLSKCDLLRKKEEDFKEKLTELRNRRRSLQAQLAITLHARDEARKDFDMAIQLGDLVDCPTCGAQYENSFAERFSIAVDEDRCAGLALTIKEELDEVELRLTTEIGRAEQIAAEIASVERLLARREGELALGDLIQQEGRRELRTIMANDIRAIEEEEGRNHSRIGQLKLRMRELDSKHRKAVINQFFSYKMQQFLHELDVKTVAEAATRSVNAKITTTGSELPRALLAFQMAFVHVMANYGSAVMAPVIIDSPNQQDQDPAHLDRMLRFTRDRCPSGVQMVLGLVDTAGVDFGGEEIHLDQRYNLLNDNDYAEARDRVQGLIDAALSDEGLRDKSPGLLF